MGAAEPAASDAALPMRHLGRYELCYELAAGGMATVYLARMNAERTRASLERIVALKLIHRHLAREPQFVDMFLDEARIASRINHPNVCTVYDFGEHDGTYFMAMELLHGESLYALLRAVSSDADPAFVRLWPAFAARIIADACEGLHAAHELRGAGGEPLHVVHRDVSPQNLFVGYDGSVKVVDFGIARAADRVHQTATGTLKGKYAYMAPEQLLRHDVDRRADVWALGVCLWEMLTRKRLFRRETDFLTIKALQEIEIPRPSSVRPDVPKDLDAIVLRALERQPTRRFATTREMGREISRYVATVGHPVGLPELADWMSKTFVEQRTRRQMLVDLAREGPTRLVPRAHGMVDEPSNTAEAITAITAHSVDVELTGASHDATTRPLGALAGGATVTDVDGGAHSAPTAAIPARRRTMVVLAAVLVAIMVGTALGVSSLLGGNADSPGDGAVASSTPLATAAVAAPATPPHPGPTPVAPGSTAEREEPLGGPVAETSVREPAAPARDKRRRRRGASAATDEPSGPVAPASGRGRVTVGCAPVWATVYLGSRHMADCPGGEFSVPAGQHVLTFRPQNRAPGVRRTVTVRPNELTRVFVDLHGAVD